MEEGSGEEECVEVDGEEGNFSSVLKSTNLCNCYISIRVW